MKDAMSIDTSVLDDRARTRKNRILAVTLAAAIMILDQLVKYIVTGPLSLQSKGQIQLLSFFDLTYAENTGISGGMLSAETDMGRWLLIGFTGAVIAAVVWWMWTEKLRGDMLALAMVLGGALGNIIDRARLGHVVDYADLHFGSFRPFLIFNVGDVAITFGVLILIARALLLRDKGGEQPQAPVQVADSDGPA
jgi:signal peptidase II